MEELDDEIKKEWFCLKETDKKLKKTLENESLIWCSTIFNLIFKKIN